MPKQELLVEVKKLISIGKEKGFLSYDERYCSLPAEVGSSVRVGSGLMPTRVMPETTAKKRSISPPGH